MLDGGYAFITAYLKGEEASILTQGHIRSMSRLNRIQDVLTAIRDTTIGKYLESVSLSNFDEIDRALWSYLSGCFKQLEWFSDLPPDIPKIVRAYAIKYDIVNIKAALLAITIGRPAKLIPIGYISDTGLLEELASAPEEEAIASLLGRCGLHDYVPIIRDYEMDGGIKSRQHTETRLEAEYYRNLLVTTEKVKDSAALIRTLGTAIDMKNLQIVVRALLGGMTLDVTEHAIDGGYVISRAMAGELISLKLNELPARLAGTQYQAVIEEIISGYDQDKNVSVVDEVIEKHALRLNREVLAMKMMSPLVVVWYLFIKELEIRNLRQIFKAVLDNVPVEEIMNNLVTAS